MSDLSPECASKQTSPDARTKNAAVAGGGVLIRGPAALPDLGDVLVGDVLCPADKPSIVATLSQK
jgi:hypothetical protein